MTRGYLTLKLIIKCIMICRELMRMKKEEVSHFPIQWFNNNLAKIRWRTRSVLKIRIAVHKSDFPNRRL